MLDRRWHWYLALGAQAGMSVLCVIGFFALRPDWLEVIAWPALTLGNLWVAYRFRCIARTWENLANELLKQRREGRYRPIGARHDWP